MKYVLWVLTQAKDNSSLILRLMLCACINSTTRVFTVQPSECVKVVSWYLPNEGYESELYSPKIYEL